VERKLILMVYSPCEAALQSAAALANEPEGYRNTYQLSVTGPFVDEPHAASATATTAIPNMTPIWRTSTAVSSLIPAVLILTLLRINGRSIPYRRPA
jgi:hypothetical protein